MPIALRLCLIWLVLLLAVLVPFVIWGDRVEAGLGTLLSSEQSSGLLLAVIFAALAGDIVLPLPSSLLSASAGMIGGSMIGTTVVFFGMSLGHLLGYMLGRSAGPQLVTRLAGADTQARLNGMGNAIGLSATLALTRAVPMLAEAATLVAGTAGMTLPRFLLACLPANLAIALVYGVMGAWAQSVAELVWVFAVAVAVPVLGYVALRMWLWRADAAA